ncbi:MAG TPA: antibiotic biosynthesis monooxygenase [Xanthobacteraceae bacterium]|nr:antibiotic biosynthesis monooxygenase [Xanthobacteraceae bacterium]
MTQQNPPMSDSVTVVIQTCVRPESAETFARWQDETCRIVASFPGFIEQTITPPSPPVQLDWVILQRFESSTAALGWLNSDQRLRRMEDVTPLLVGRDDVHIVSDANVGVLPAPVSAVISTRIKSGQETAYRAWEQRIAAAQSKARGFQGYRFEPPVPGVQDHWLAIVRFDAEANLQAWLNAPERHRLLEEARSFAEEHRIRIARTGFDQWFAATAGKTPAAWKQNMLVLLMLYPVVYLLGALVQTPLLSGRAGLPFSFALFFGNVMSVLALSYLVPLTSKSFTWWLVPAGVNQRRIEIGGTALIIALYGLMVLIFWRFF